MNDRSADVPAGVLRRPSGSTLVFEQLDSEVLRGNPLDDPHRRDLVTYLPPGYDGARRYPVIYCLTGFTGTGRGLLNTSPWTEGLHERLDRLIAAGDVMPLIAVLPDCFTLLGGSQYLNSAATGRYEDYLLEEIVPHVDRRFATAARPGCRAVMGKSSGGYGAFMQAMRHPDVFGLAACHSGDMYFEYCYKPEFPKLANGLWRHGGVRAFLEQFRRQPKKASSDIAVLNILAMAACYSPDPDGPLGIGLPIDPQTGIVQDEVWKRWLACDPVMLVERYADNLRRLRLLFLDCGTRDEFHLHIGAREMSRRLQRLGIEHVHEEFDDTHMGLTYRYDVSLRRVSDAFEGPGA
ncbi:MAG: alpha/beta hydrolase-fold protein [Candidatus Eiseniibacteriota bacterium]|jgi:enterochelin esterase family protein